MTLEEAIKHSEQAAEWLRELKYYREECEIFKVNKVIQEQKAVKKVMATVRLKDGTKKIFK